ncbi:MAG: NAD(P)-binding domain-containing protein [Coriobacteriia bacterium]|nr:NAD(P)-binding domain-containing protein [Coriobacteriia bacterium]
MELLVIGDEERFYKHRPDPAIADKVTCVVVPRGTANEKIAAALPDAEFLLVDPICPVSRELVEVLPRLRVIHSEGVAYNLIDLAAARSKGIVVCNCKGVNAGAVAEHAVLLMLSCLRDVVNGDQAVREGRQIQTKEHYMLKGFKELGDCKIGFIGAGDSGQATMTRLKSWNSEMAYFKRTPLSAEQESQLGARFEPLDSLLATSDIISLHVPVTGETANMVDAVFLGKMKQGSILINTARGEIVDSQALGDALVCGHLAAAGLDTLYPEPVTLDNILLNLPEEAARRIVFSPHMGGITEGTFGRVNQTVWENIARFLAGEPLMNRVF